ncbi:Protein of unknown function [Pyronema omphalodes CBS 100304]|uniref:Uncharacterized protein n=1 Tax=Pyronema omphalodes (strain CBS 100304) TaxID=1076935 RepID=U4LF87_PYROM|nr:Protein of unknown function [Pyronema omphalodes CBS 100304]
MRVGESPNLPKITGRFKRKASENEMARYLACRHTIRLSRVYSLVRDTPRGEQVIRWLTPPALDFRRNGLLSCDLSHNLSKIYIQIQPEKSCFKCQSRESTSATRR